METNNYSRHDEAVRLTHNYLSSLFKGVIDVKIYNKENFPKWNPKTDSEIGDLIIGSKSYDLKQGRNDGNVFISKTSLQNFRGDGYIFYFGDPSNSMIMDRIFAKKYYKTSLEKHNRGEGNNIVRGKSGEWGCLFHIPSLYSSYSINKLKSKIK